MKALYFLGWDLLVIFRSFRGPVSVGLRFMSTGSTGEGSIPPKTQDGKLQTFAKSQGTQESEGCPEVVELKRLEPGGWRCGDIPVSKKTCLFFNKFGVELWVFVPCCLHHIALME